MNDCVKLSIHDRYMYYNKPPPSVFLMHYGVKGMKWGVHRTPEELGHKLKSKVAKAARNDTIVADAIASGLVSKKINREKQIRHTKSGHIPGRSYLDGDLEYAQKLIDELSGTGEACLDRQGKWNHKEFVVSPYIIGTHVDKDSVETKTNKATIVYSKTGCHIFPRRR